MTFNNVSVNIFFYGREECFQNWLESGLLLYRKPSTSNLDVFAACTAIAEDRPGSQFPLPRLLIDNWRGAEKETKRFPFDRLATGMHVERERERARESKRERPLSDKKSASCKTKWMWKDKRRYVLRSSVSLTKTFWVRRRSCKK